MLLEQPKKEYLRCNFWLPLFLKHNYNVVIGADLQRANSVQGTAVFLQRQPFVSINKGVVPRILFLCFEIRPADWDSKLSGSCPLPASGLHRRKRKKSKPSTSRTAPKRRPKKCNQAPSGSSEIHF